MNTERGDIRQPAGTECFSPLINASSSSAKRISAGRRRSAFWVGVVDIGCFVQVFKISSDLSDWSGAMVPVLRGIYQRISRPGWLRTRPIWEVLLLGHDARCTTATAT